MIKNNFFRILNNKKSDSLFILLLIIYSIFILSYSGTVPFWDAWRSIDIVIKAAITSPFNILNFDNAGHPAFVWQFILGLLQYIDYGNPYFLHGTVLVFSIFAIISFRHILKKIFLSKDLEIEILIVTALFAFFPIFNANALHINQDYGILVFFLIFLAFLFSGRHTLAAISAIGLLFSKEPGIVLYTITLFFYFMRDAIKKRSLRLIISLWIKKRFLFILPYIFFIWRLWERSRLFPDEVFLVGFNPIKGDLSMVYPTFTSEMIKHVPLSYLLAIFVVQFNWILTLGIVLGLVFFLLRVYRRKHILLLQYDYFVMLMCVFVVSFFAFTHYITFTNVRYFLPLYALMIILFYNGLVLIFSKYHWARKSILIFIFFLFFFSQFRLLDPVSKGVYGTFRFGRHDMLKMTSITHECCGYGRDQLVYNLQFLEFSYLQDRIYPDLRPDSTIGIAYDKWESPEILGRLDKKTYKRTFREKDTIDPFHPIYPYLLPIVLNWNYKDPVKKPDTIYFIEFPNMENQQELSQYLDFYTIASKKKYEQEGYVMIVYRLERNKTVL